MECCICMDKSVACCSSCSNSFCTRCMVECDECKRSHCLTCSNACDSCGVNVCNSCTLTIDTCSCCKQDFHSVVCVSCVAKSWLKMKATPQCEECKQYCNKCGTCNVNSIIKGQTSCPICLDDFDGNGVFQYCGVHLVCKECDADIYHSKGCPICRKGKTTLETSV